MTCSGVYVPCIYMQKNARLWSLCTLYLHAEGCTFVEFVSLVFTCRRMYVCGVCVPCIYMQKAVRLWSLCTLYAERCTVCRVYVPCIYMKDVRLWSLCTLYLHAEGCTVCGVCVPCMQNDVPFLEFMYLVST